MLFLLISLAVHASATLHHMPKRNISVLDSRSSVIYENTSSIWPWQNYQTEPDLTPPALSITWNNETLQPGAIFLTPRNFNGSNATREVSPILLDSAGDLIWDGPHHDPASSYEFNNFKIQRVNGTDYLTYWSGINVGNINSSHGYGNITFLNKHYQTTHVICPQLNLTVLPGIPHPCDADLSEALLTPHGTILITAYNLTTVDLTPFNGSSTGYIYDSQIHEIDIFTSRSIWSWSALAHIPLSASQLPLPTNTTAEPWDYAHINSISLYGSNLVLSARHTWEIYGISRNTSEIQWTFNGETGGDWGVVPEEATFSWQHHVSVRDFNESSVTLSMFGNHNYNGANGTKGTAPSVGREHFLNLPPDKVSPLTLYTLNESVSLWSDSQGSYDYTPPSSKNTSSRFLSYGQLPLLREFTVGPAYNATNLQWEARYGYDNEVSSYRSFKAEWYGVPLTKPELVVKGNGTAYMSWNGATHVSAWEIYRSDNGTGTELGVLEGVAVKKGFETAVDLGSGCWVVRAVHDGGWCEASEVRCM